MYWQGRVRKPSKKKKIEFIAQKILAELENKAAYEKRLFMCFYKQHNLSTQLVAAYLISPCQSQPLQTEPLQTSKIESLTTIAKLSILNVCGGPATRPGQPNFCRKSTCFYGTRFCRHKQEFEFFLFKFLVNIRHLS